MQSLLHKGIEPSAPLADSITFLTAIKHLQSISTDNTPVVVEKIKDLLASSNNRLYGLMLLKAALEQNIEVYGKGAWPKLLPDILNDSVAPSLKEYSCEVFCMLLPYMKKEASNYTLELRKFSKEVFPFLISQIDDSVEWSKAGLKCICTCLRVFPQLLLPYKEHLLNVILKKVSYSVSSEIFEIVAECFAELPNLQHDLIPDIYIVEWKRQYLTTLNTLHQLLDMFLRSDPFASVLGKIDAGVYIFCDDEDSSDDVVRAYFKGARRFINLCRCMAKMLSTKSRFAVAVPVKMTIIFISRLFQTQQLKNVKPAATELQLFYSFLSQMQLATLVVLESLILNLDVLAYAPIIADLVLQALDSSKLQNISVETVSEIRLAVWKILKIFIKKYGSSVSVEVIKVQHAIIPELLIDISIQEKSREDFANQTSPKLKKAAANSGKKKYLSESYQQACKEALEAFEQLIYTGYFAFSKNDLKDIFSKTLQIAYKLHISSNDNFPPPYSNESCRKNLYSVLLSFALISNMDQREFAHSTVRILKNAFQDSSIEVTGFCNIAMAMLNVKIHPKQPPFKYKSISERPRSKVSSAVVRCSEWSSDPFIPDLPLENTSKVHENTRLALTFQDPNEEEAILQEEEPIEEDVGAIEEVMVAEPHYSESYASDCYVAKYHEQGSENQHNGDDILEIHQSNQCQDEESDEEDEEEEEEEEDDRSYGEEEINQGDIAPENMYIPSTSKLQGVSPVHISPETRPQNVSDREYEQLRPCVKAETSNVESNKNMHLNGMHSIVPDADVPSSSTRPSLANENGGYPYDDEEDLEEEEENEEDDDESLSFHAEKRMTMCYSPNLPSKRQKLDNDEPRIEILKEEAGPSPPSLSLDTMKSDFICTEIAKDVKS